MYVFRKMNSLALMGGLSLVLAGIMACSTDDTTSSKNGEELPIVIDSIVTIDSNGNRVVTYDTIHPTVDSIVQIDPVTGETVVIYDTVYIPADTTVRWVGNSSLIITEIAPVNLNWLDENGDDPGWVEIYNAGDEEAPPEDRGLDHAADAGAFQPAEEAVARDERRERERRQIGREPCQRREDRDARQAARDRREEDAERRDDRREMTSAFSIIQHEVLRDRLKRRASERLRVEEPHDDEREARADREPPSRKPDRARELRRADRRAAADARAGDRPRDHRHAGRPPAEAVALRRVHGTCRIDPAAKRQSDRHGHQRHLEDGKLHETRLLSLCFHLIERST